MANHSPAPLEKVICPSPVIMCSYRATWHFHLTPHWVHYLLLRWLTHGCGHKVTVKRIILSLGSLSVCVWVTWKCSVCTVSGAVSDLAIGYPLLSQKIVKLKGLKRSRVAKGPRLTHGTSWKDSGSWVYILINITLSWCTQSTGNY